MASDQQRVIDVLADPRTHGGAAVERIETHSAIVFLAGRRALKMKRAVKFDYLDFSTLDLRRLSCEAEVRINSRAAPAIYRGVAAVTQARRVRGARGRTAARADIRRERNTSCFPGTCRSDEV